MGPPPQGLRRRLNSLVVAAFIPAFFLGAALLAGCASRAPEPPLYPPPADGDKDPIDWWKVIEERIEPLAHDRGERWPLILWNNGGYDPLGEETVRMLLSRGITQHIRLHPSMIPAAQALARAGSPVIVMEGRSGAWPYPLAGDPSQWAHRYAADADVPEAWRKLPSPTLFKGWAEAAGRLRRTLEAFRRAGVTIDAAWLDYEGEPRGASFEAAKASPSTMALLPARAMESKRAFYRFRRQLWMQLVSTYVAAPIREVFPKASVTNWMASLSAPDRPVLGWQDQVLPSVGLSMFTATNPVAYGIDLYFDHAWKEDYPLDRDHVDRLYTHLLLRQVSDDAYNRDRMAPYLKSVPWVGRWVALDRDKVTPVMSREGYREALRHLWLRGIDAMQVFNSGASAELEIGEVEDTAAVYGEMLAFRKFLEDGRVMNFDYPGVQEGGPFWSGLSLEREAVVRVASRYPATISLEPWEGRWITLAAPRGGATYLLTLTEGGIEATEAD